MYCILRYIKVHMSFATAMILKDLYFLNIHQHLQFPKDL